MEPNTPLQGLWCATLSPLDARGGLDAGRLAAHVKRLLAAGVDGVAPFGTTGEGQSFSVAERRAGLDALLAAGVAPHRLLAATGAAALPDAIELTRHAIAAGCVGSLALPPFFFKDVSDDGLYAAYARLIDGVGDPRLRLVLYHIPQVSGVAVPVAVVARLAATYPGVVVGVKDSGGDLAHSRALLAVVPRLAIFVGHEPHLQPMRKLGGAGTICGIANLYPRLMRRLYDRALEATPGEESTLIERLLSALAAFPIFGALRALQAALAEDAAWATPRPPLLALSAEQARRLRDAVGATGIDPARDGAPRDA